MPNHKHIGIFKFPDLFQRCFAFPTNLKGLSGEFVLNIVFGDLMGNMSSIMKIRIDRL